MMLKYQDLIRNLRTKEKLDLIISSKRLQNGEIKNYDLPKFNNVSDFKEITKDKFSNLFSLSLTWNNSLVRSVARSIASANHDKIINIKLEDEYAKKEVSSSPYLEGKIVSSLINGIKDESGLSSLSYIPNGLMDDTYFTYKLFSSEIILKESSPFFVETKNENIKELNEVLKYKGYYSYTHTEKNGIEKALCDGATIISTHQRENIEEAIRLYKEYYKKLEDGKITRDEFNKLESDGVIFNEGKLDVIVDNILESLAIYDEVSEIKNEEEIDLGSLADESILLLKKDDVIPLKQNDVLQIVGGVFEDNLIEEIPAYTIHTSNYTRGYFDGIDSTDLIPDMIKATKINDSNIILVGIKVDKHISNDNIKLLEYIKNNNVFNKKIILVVVSNNMLDDDLGEYADLILFAPCMNKEYANGLLRILTGKSFASARNPFATSVYPLGYGLSNGEFQYSNLKIRNLRLSVAVENISDSDAYEVIEVYSKCPFEGERRLAGYKKVFLHAYEKNLFEIPLNDKAFSVYSTEHKSFMINEGVYEISVGRNIDDIIDTLEVNLKEFIETPNTITYEEESINDSKKEAYLFLNKTDNPYKMYHTSFKKKFIISTLIAIYFLALFIGLIVYDVINDNFELNIKSYVLIGLSALTFILYVIFIIKSLIINAKTPKEKDASLESVLNNSSSFDVDHFVTYEKPVLNLDLDSSLDEELEEEDIEDEVEEVEEIKEEVKEPEVIDFDVFVSDAKDDEDYDDSYVAKDIVYEEVSNYQKISLDDLTVKFNDYALESGYVLELSEIRALLASVLSTKLLFIGSNNNEYLKGVLTLLNRFFGSKASIHTISDDVFSMKDLLWKPEGGVYTYSDFTVDILKAKSNPKGLELMVLDNVNMATFPRYFYKFIKKSQADKLPLYLKLDHNYQIPNNICYIVILSGNYSNFISPALMDKALFLNINIGVGTLKDVNIEPVSYELLTEDLTEAKDEYYLSEDDWKKLDDLEDEMKKKDKYYTHTNISALLTDKFATSLYTLDNERYVLDDILAMYYVPLLKCTGLYKRKNGDLEIKALLCQIFEESNIPLALKELSRGKVYTTDLKDNESVDSKDQEVINEDLNTTDKKKK